MSVVRLSFALAGLVLSVLPLGQGAPSAATREIAVTIDDLPTASVLGNDLAVAERTTAALLASLDRHRVPAIGFVNEGKLRTDGRVDDRRVALLQRWIDAGLELGNHTFSHLDLHRTALDVFERDVLSGEKVTRALLARAGRPLRYFRHPFLHTGRTLQTKRAFEAFLKKRGYRVAPVSVDNYDYVFAAAYDRAGAKQAGDLQGRIASAYVDYMTAVVSYYEQQSSVIVGREIRQILLIHASALNAATFDGLAAMLASRGYRFVTLDRALEDPAYTLADTFVGTSGITWLHRWALTQGKRGIFAGEPEVPGWVTRASQ